MKKFLFPPTHVVSRAQKLVLAAFFVFMATFVAGCTSYLGWALPGPNDVKLVVAAITTPAPPATIVATKAAPPPVSPAKFVRSHQRMQRAFTWLAKYPAGREALRRHYATYGQLELSVPIDTVAQNGAMATALVRKHHDLFNRLHAAGTTNTAALTRALAQNHLGHLPDLKAQFGEALAVNRPSKGHEGKVSKV